MVTGKQVAVIVAVSLLSFCGYLVYDSGDVFPGAEPPDDNPNQFWVRIDGNDSCNGQNNMSYVEDNTDCAWLTVGHGVSTIAAGQTLRVQTGTYNENVTLANSGNATSPISIIGDGNPILDGEYVRDYGFAVSGKEYFTIDGFTIQNFSDIGVYVYTGVSIHNATLTNCTLRNISGQGAYFRNIGYGYFEHLVVNNNTFYNLTVSDFEGAIRAPLAHNSTFSNNTIYDISGGCGIVWAGNHTVVEYNNCTNIEGKALSTGKSHYSTVRYNTIDTCARAIRFDYYCKHNDILNNKVNNTSQFGIQMYPETDWTTIQNNELYNSSIQARSNHTYIYNNTLDGGSYVSIHPGLSASGGIPYTSENLTFKGNTLKNCKYITVANQTNMSITNNIFMNMTSSHGALFFGFSHVSAPSYNVNILNNIFYLTPYDAIDISESSGETTCTIKNNIFMNVSGFCVDKNTGENITVSYNSVYNNGTSPAFDNVIDDNTIYLDPLFANVTAYDFHLNSTVGRWNGTHWVTDAVSSPCIGAGDPADDYSNEPAPNGARINMGAYGNTVEASKSSETTPAISNIQNGSVNSTAQYVSATINQSANNVVIYDTGSASATTTDCTGQWSATHACANASDGNWSSYAESAGAMNAYAYFNHTVPAGTSQSESLWHVKDAAGHANVTIPAACWGATLYLRAIGSDIGNSMTWQCDNGPGWTTLRSSVANHAYEEEMSLKCRSTWDNATAAPNITLSGLTASTGYNFYVRACNITNEALCSNSSVYTFTTAATSDSAETFVNPTWVLLSGAFVVVAGWLAKRWGNRRRKRQ